MCQFLRLVGLALVATCLAAPTATAADRPFHGTASGSIVALDPATGAGIAQYTGQATHLGRFSRVEHFQLDGLGGITGTMVFTAANGDELHSDFEGHFVSPTTVVGTYEFTGGTGRFHDAAGTAEFTATLGDQGHVGVVFSGSIQY
jgi:hypothetical protein